MKILKNKRKKHQPIFKKIKYQTVETDLSTKKLTLIDHKKSRTYYNTLHEINIEKPFRNF